VYWTFADDTYTTTDHAYNGNGDVVADVYESTIWSSLSDGLQNLHRYNSHLNYELLIPLGDLVKENGEPLNGSDVFGLSILTTDGDDIGFENPVVWQNWNETTGLTFYDESVSWDEAEEYFFNKTYATDKTILDRWGEGEIGSGGTMSNTLAYGMHVDVSWNDTVALAGEDWCLVNMSVIVNNTGSGTLDDIYLNQSWWNCSCSDLNMTFVDSNQSHSNFTWFNDSCYWWIHNSSVTLASGESWSFYVNLNITACPGTTTDTETMTTVGNATNLTGTVNGDTITFRWGYTPHIRVSWGNVALAAVTEANYGILVFMSLLAMVIVAVIIVAYVSKFSGGGV